MPLRPQVHQATRRAGIETEHAVVGGGQCRDVGDPAEVEHDPVLVVAVQHGGVVCRRQRRALAACRHVASAEVIDRGDAGQLGDDIRVAELGGDRRCAVGVMCNRLAMAADRADRVAVEGVGRHERVDGLREEVPDVGIQACDLGRVQRVAAGKGADPLQQVVRPGRVGAGLQRWAGVVKAHTGDVHGIHAGAGHDADVHGCRAQLSRRVSALATIVADGIAASWVSRVAVCLRKLAISDLVSDSDFGSLTRSGSRCTPLTRNS